MPKFTTRIELHSGHKSYDQLSANTYQVLHQAMEEEGFTRTIVLSGIEYHLPNAEYNKHGLQLTKGQVLAAAQRACRQTGRDYSILITQSSGRIGFGLKPVMK
jgi:hypothetical protein